VCVIWYVDNLPLSGKVKDVAACHRYHAGWASSLRSKGRIFIFQKRKGETHSNLEETLADIPLPD